MKAWSYKIEIKIFDLQTIHLVKQWVKNTESWPQVKSILEVNTSPICESEDWETGVFIS